MTPTTNRRSIIASIAALLAWPAAALAGRRRMRRKSDWTPVQLNHGDSIHVYTCPPGKRATITEMNVVAGVEDDYAQHAYDLTLENIRLEMLTDSLRSLLAEAREHVEMTFNNDGYPDEANTADRLLARIDAHLGPRTRGHSRGYTGRHRNERTQV